MKISEKVLGRIETTIEFSHDSRKDEPKGDDLAEWGLFFGEKSSELFKELAKSHKGKPTFGLYLGLVEVSAMCIQLLEKLESVELETKTTD